jgi:hypothetical protein
MSVEIDGVELNLQGGRRFHGPVHELKSPGGIKEVIVSGLLTGSNGDDLNLKWAETKLACTQLGARVRVKPDSTTPSSLVDCFPGDADGTIQVSTFVSSDPTRVPTATSYPFTLHIVATLNIVTGGGGGTPPGRFEGQVGDYRLTTAYNDARVESRALIASFGSLFDKDASGPFTIDSVSNVGGKARFNLASLPDGTSGPTIYVSGSNLYDGPHVITEIDTDADQVVTSTAYAGDDAGTCMIGETTPPEEHYTAARESLLQQIGCDSDGSRNTTTGLVLASESFGKEAETLTVFLASVWTEREYNAALRSFQMAVEVIDVPDWPDDPEAGPPPKLIGVVVTFAVDRVAAGTPNPYPMWYSIRPQVIARLKAGSDGEVTGPIEEKVAFDENTGTAIVTLGFLANNAIVFSFARTVNFHRRLEYMAWKDPEGYAAIQTDADPIDQLVTIGVSRSGVGEIDIESLIETPEDPEYTYIDITADIGLEQPVARREVGSIFAQTAIKVFRRFRLRTGEDPRVRVPTTGAF